MGQEADAHLQSARPFPHCMHVAWRRRQAQGAAGGVPGPRTASSALRARALTAAPPPPAAWGEPCERPLRPWCSAGVQGWSGQMGGDAKGAGRRSRRRAALAAATRAGAAPPQPHTVPSMAKAMQFTRKYGCCTRRSASRQLHARTHTPNALAHTHPRAHTSISQTGSAGRPRSAAPAPRSSPPPSPRTPAASSPAA